MCSPRPVCSRILITLQDDSLVSVVDACLFQFGHIYRERGDWLDFVKKIAHAENFQSHFLSWIPVGGDLLTLPGSWGM